MNGALKDLITLLDLESLEVNLFRGQSYDHGRPSVFGGQVVGQGLVAAQRTVERDRPVHSLHAYFLRPGDIKAPIVYDVDRVRDGRSFATRRVQAIQHGEVIFTMMASFQKREPGFNHQVPVLDVPPPEALKSFSELAQEWLAQNNGKIEGTLKFWLEREAPVEFRPVEPRNPIQPDARPPSQHFWFRAAGTLGDDPLLHRNILAYSTDFMLISTALLPHARAYSEPQLQVASIDHAVWFHREFRMDEWLLYTMDSPTAQASRGLARGQIFDRNGQLVASVAQEGLLRLMTKS